MTSWCVSRKRWSRTWRRLCTEGRPLCFGEGCVCVCVCVFMCVTSEQNWAVSYGFCGMGTVLTCSVMILQPCITIIIILNFIFIVLIIILVSGTNWCNSLLKQAHTTRCYHSKQLTTGKWNWKCTSARYALNMFNMHSLIAMLGWNDRNTLIWISE